MSQLYLRFGVGRLCTHGKNVENKRGAVENFNFQLVLNIAHLFGRQLVVEYHHAYFALVILLIFYVFSYLLKLAFAHIGYLTWPSYTLRKAPDGNGSCRIGQKFKLIKIFLCFGFVLLWRNKPHENSGFGLGFRDYKFLHLLCYSYDSAKI